MQKSLLILLSKEPYSFEKTSLAVVTASKAAEKDVDVTIFLIEDGVLATRPNQKPARGANFGDALTKLIEKGVEVLAEDLSLAARGLSTDKLLSGIRISNISELTDLIMEKSDRVIWV